MEVILLADVKNVGKKGQIVEVSAGYATNFLIKRKLAVPSTEKSREIKKEQDEAAKALFEQNKANAIELKEKLEKVRVQCSAKAGSDGRMFGSISTKEVVEELNKQFGLVIDKKKFLGDTSIKSFGTSKLSIELFKGVIASIYVDVKEK